MRSAYSLRFASALAAALGSSIALAQAPPPSPPGTEPAPAPGETDPNAKPDTGEKPAEPAPPAPTTAPPAESSAAPAPSSPPPPDAAATAAPPTAATPVLSPSTSRTQADTGVSNEQSTTPKPPETTFGIQIDGGYGTRLGDASRYEFTKSETGGLVFGPSLWLAPSRVWSVGLAYQHSSLGSDRAVSGIDSMDVGRSLDLIWLGGRAFPWRTDSLGVFLTLGIGVGWQHVSVSGTRASQDFVQPATAFVCSASDGPGLALGGGAGLYIDIDRNIGFVTQLDTLAHRQTSDVIGGCAPGSGSLTTLGARIGFEYRFDLGDSMSSSARVKRGNSALLR